MKNKVLKPVLLGIFVFAAIAGCKKDNVEPSDNMYPNGHTPIVDTLPFADPGVDTLPVVDPEVDTLPDLTSFDTIPTSIEGFDIRGRWIWGMPESPNRFVMNFRDDSIVVFKEYLYDPENYYVTVGGYDSAMYRTIYSNTQAECRVLFYHCWRPNGSVADYTWDYLPTVYDNQNTMFLYFTEFRTYDVTPAILDIYLTRYE